MSINIKLMPTEFEHVRARSQRKCTKPFVLRMVAICLLVSLVVLMTVVYNAIVLERVDKLRQIMTLKERHQHRHQDHASESTQPLMKLVYDTGTLVEREEAPTIVHLATQSEENGLHLDHGRFHLAHKHSRAVRDATDAALDPLYHAQNVHSLEPNFKELYEKVRNKRERFALAKLEQEYVRCKKQTMIRNNDCMVAFAKMYKITKELSEKLEKMQEIFKDSETILQQSSSMQQSVESKETQKTSKEEKFKEQTTTQTTSTVKIPQATTTTTNEKEQAQITETNATIFLSTSPTTTPASALPESSTLKAKVQKDKPVKISWIIDGNDSEIESDEYSNEQNNITATTATTTTTSTAKTTTIGSTAVVMANVTDVNESSTALPLVTTNTTINEMGENVTTTSETTTTEKPEKISWILDGNDDSVEINTNGNITTTTTKTTIMSDLHTENQEENSKMTTAGLDVNNAALTKATITEKLPSVTTETNKKDENDDDTFDFDEQLRKLEIYGIIDDDDLTAEISDEDDERSTNTTITPAPTITTEGIEKTETTKTTKLPPIKYSWILDSDANSAEKTADDDQTIIEDQSGGLQLNKNIKISNKTDVTVSYSTQCTTTTTTENKQSDCGFESSTTFSPTTSAIMATTNAPDKGVPQERVHPLDAPSSLENMLEHFEEHENLQPLLQERTGDTRNDSLNFERAKWEKLFQQAAMLRAYDELMYNFGDQLNEERVSEPETKRLGEENVQGSKAGQNKQFLSFCDRVTQHLNKQNVNKDNNTTIKPENMTAAASTHAPSVQFTSRGPLTFPVTGESMKASAQIMLNSNLMMPTIPICFYVTPTSFRIVNQSPIWTPSTFSGMSGGLGGMSGGFGGMSGGFGGGMTNTPFGGSPTAGGVFMMPQNIGTTTHFSANGSGTGNAAGFPNVFAKNVTPQNSQQQPQTKQQQVYCTYMQNQPSKQYTQSGSDNSAGGTSSNSHMNYSNANFKLRAVNQTLTSNIIYASYAGLSPQLDSKQQFKCSLPGQVACYGGNECIREDAWCDGEVHCSDGSDETTCTCRDRLLPERMCDGYPDCPMGEDEIGCFGCDDFMYSCYEHADEYQRHNRSTVSMCYSALEKCDGFTNCFNGRDEQECSIIVSDVTHHMSHSVSVAEGFLYHNHRGQWYPVCNNAEKWARAACEAEGGLVGEPNVSYQAATLPGPFVEPSLVGTVHFAQSCQKRDGHDELVDQGAYVRCAPAQCGIIKTSPSIRAKRKLIKQLGVKLRRKIRRDVGADSSERIVGGSYSKPLHWPFIVAVFRNGRFHCGGSIYSEKWIISAAHCVINYPRYYYEVRAGLLRRSSYSSSTQIRSIARVLVHEGYERRSMLNDLSLLGLAQPLSFNRWVKPICLPDIGRSTMGDDWIWGPDENTLCTVVGWGAIREKGPGSDPLREVIVPIRKGCVDIEDRKAEDICAGDPNGGRDACQGDSGGPLFCRSMANMNEWYLAGVVSHGNGCARAREFGVYTRVALYLDWIENATRSAYSSKSVPLQFCPGFTCVWGGQHCISQRKRCDRVVDCLGGEDEVGCIYNAIPDVGSALNVTVTSTTESDYHPESGESEEDEIVMKTRTGEEAVEGEQEDGASLFTDVPPDLPIVTAQLPVSDSLITKTENFEMTTTETLTISTEAVEETQISPETDLSAKSSTVRTIGTLTTTTSTTTTTTTSPATPTTTETINSTAKFTVTTPSSTTKITTTTNFEFIDPTFDATDAPIIKPITVNKVINTTTTTKAPAKIPDKFICQTIPQIIDIIHRCDRIVDCDDGSDEEGCLCRDYLKGSLNILICDGKTDCDDLSDEDNCGNCGEDEYLCGLSKTCLPLEKRCDNVIDCKYKEDEQNCFALTNGKEITLDSNKQPTLSNVGIFSRNMHGVWRVVCSHETDYHTHGAKTAADVCSLLGFKGFKYFNTTEFITHGMIVPIEPGLDHGVTLKPDISKALRDNLHFANAEHGDKLTLQLHNARSGALTLQPRTEKCQGLYLECQAKSNLSPPLKTLSAGGPIKAKQLQPTRIEPTLKTHGKPNVYVTPQPAPVLLVEKKEEILKKLHKLVESKKNTSTVLVHDKLHEGMEELHWPWLVDVYAHGRLWCIGLLVDKHWIMVHESCLYAVRLNTDYVAALFGGGKTKHLLHKSTHEQIRRVDCYESVPHSDVVLYHLDQPVHYTHHVLPTFLPESSKVDDSHSNESNEDEQHECLAVLHENQNGRAKTVAIKEQKNDHLCSTAELSCYRLLEKKPPVNLLRRTQLSAEEFASVSDEIELKTSTENNGTLNAALSQLTSCTQFGNKNENHQMFGDITTFTSLEPTDQGILVCHDTRNSSTGWFPVAVFEYNNTNCNSFKEPFAIRTLSKVYPSVQQIIDQSSCTQTHAAPLCNTHRCSLGACLQSSQVCDGRNDCHDGSDETPEMCRKQKSLCGPTELTCRSDSKCVPKSKFCDHVPDCEDLTDEPTICSCFTYLQATDPTKICDGIRNCWDKSDESPVLCNCTASHYACNSPAKECIPRDFVCDRDPDCPNGEDEKYCFGIEQPAENDAKQLNDNWQPAHKDFLRPPAYGQVIEQSYGIWHTKCFPRNSPPDVAELRRICKNLGYDPYRQPSYRLIDDAVNEVVQTYEWPDAKGRSFSNDSLIGKYRDATKTIVVSKFSPLRLNDELTLFIKASRPIAELVRWNVTDSNSCYRLEIRCA